MFIKLHLFESGVPMRIQINSIIYYFTSNTGTWLNVMNCSAPLQVTESDITIDELIKKELE